MAAPLDRRRLLLGTALLSAGSLTAACKRRSETCPPSQLSSEEAKVRQALQYTDRSPDPQKLCNGCQQYLPDTDADCGGCKLMKGFVHPAGYCAAFSAKS